MHKTPFSNQIGRMVHVFYKNRTKKFHFFINFPYFQFISILNIGVFFSMSLLLYSLLII